MDWAPSQQWLQKASQKLSYITISERCYSFTNVYSDRPVQPLKVHTVLTLFEPYGRHLPNGRLPHLHILVQFVQEVPLMLRIRYPRTFPRWVEPDPEAGFVGAFVVTGRDGRGGFGPAVRVHIGDEKLLALFRSAFVLGRWKRREVEMSFRNMKRTFLCYLLFGQMEMRLNSNYTFNTQVKGAPKGVKISEMTLWKRLSSPT